MNTPLSVKFPGRSTVLWLVGFFFSYLLIKEQLYSAEPEWGLIIPPILFIAFAGYYLGRFVLSPDVLFNDKGVYINTTFVLYENITQFRLISPAINIDIFRKHKRVELFYKDANESVRSARFMLLFFRGIIDRQVPIHEFLKYVKEANKDFVFDHASLYPPHH